MGGFLCIILITLSSFAMVKTSVKNDLDKSQVLILILNQLRMKLSTQITKQSVQAMKQALQYSSELDMQQQISLKKLTCMVADLNDQMSNITKSYRYEKVRNGDLQAKLETITKENKEYVLKVQYMDNKLGESERRVQQLEQQLKTLKNKVQAQAGCMTIGKPLERLPEITNKVQAYSNNRDWDTLKRGLEAVMNHSSDEYSQLQQTMSLYDVGYYGYIQLATLLLCAGLPVETYDANKNSMIHGAATSGQLQMVKLLLDHGADVNTKGDNNFTPLIRAARSDRLEVVKWLVQAGADTTAKSEDGFTALDWAKLFRYTGIIQHLEMFPH